MSLHSKNSSNPSSLSRRSVSIDKLASKMSEVYKKERVDVDEEATEAAASALTALSIQPKKEEDTEESAFEIPERFTKSGRKKAVPFPVKVRKKKGGCAWITQIPTKSGYAFHQFPLSHPGFCVSPAHESSIRPEF
jgi:hypothetical protein